MLSDVTCVEYDITLSVGISGNPSLSESGRMMVSLELRVHCGLTLLAPLSHGFPNFRQ